jgi:phage regulator Rha-like protein
MNDVMISKNLIESKILNIRGEQVMLDSDLAKLYGVETRVLNQAVKRNIDRFPADFMFRLNKEEAESSRSQFVTLKKGTNIKYLPFVFTEHGVLMLSSVLNSKKAIQINIAIMRVFILMRKLTFSYELLDKRLSAVERKYGKQDEKIDDILKTISYLIRGNTGKRKVIKGFEYKNKK